MPTIDSSQPPSPIERVLIFHLHLPEKCSNGKSLGEGASVDEISESILYYHRDHRCGIESPDEQADGKLHAPHSQVSLTEEAVQFLGLCTALQSLPASLGDPDLQNDKSDEIYFGNSTLVFIPLESSQEVLAVVQVARLYQNGNKLDSGGGNPLAVRASIERCHRLFCMLRGGGIVHRLEQNENSEDKEPNGSPYPGMGKIFVLLKESRRLKDQLSRDQRRANSQDTLDNQVLLVQLEIRALRKTLPIQAVRRDLDAHYKEFLSNLSVIVSRNGGASRCLVENVPNPIAQDSGNHVFQSFPSDASSYSVVSLGLALRRMLLKDFTKSPSNDPHLLGVSTFHKGQLVYTHLLDEFIRERFACNSELPSGFNVSNETVCLLMSYMASYRTKMSQLSAVSQPKSLPNTPPRGGLGLKRLTLSFGSLADEAVQNVEESGNRDIDERVHPSHFMPPPPLFMFSALDHAYFLDGENGRKVWAPKIHLPLLASFEGHNQNMYLDTHVVLFELGGFSFLLCMSLEAHNKNYEELPTCKFFLKDLEEQLSEAVSVASDNSSSGILSNPETSSQHWGEPGQDVILVSRTQHKLILFSDRKPVVARERKKPPPGRSPPRRFLGFGARHSDKKSSLSNSHARDPSIEWSALGLDCRHLLASHLHLDTILAFDDMMNEVSRRKRTGLQDLKDSSNLLSQGSLELCTCMPLGWIYALVDGDTELYAFFDSSIYVTVSDVQSAAMKIRARLFGHFASDNE